MATFGETKTAIKQLLWPNGTPETHVGPIDNSFIEGWVEMQRNIECLKLRQETIHPGCSVYFRCGMSVFDRPRGIINRVYTVWGSDNCNPIKYENVSVDRIRCWSRTFMEITDAPANVGMATLELGFKFSESSTDSDFGRALRGMWAIDGDRVIVSPWIQSNEKIVVEWQGIKREWEDDDTFTTDPDVLRCLRYWVKWSYEAEFGCDSEARVLARANYDEALADLIIECRRETAQKKDAPCEAEQNFVWRTWTDTVAEEFEEDTADVSTTRVFAAFGDYGEAGDNELAVAQMVAGWDPDGILALGDNNYPSGEADTIDDNVGQYYVDFIYPYSGGYTQSTDVTENKFNPLIGNHDEDSEVSGVAAGPYLQYFTHLNGNRVYDFVDGEVHYFMLESGYNSAGEVVAPMGNDVDSIQAEFVRTRIGQSTAKWKVVCLHHPPFTSDELYAPGYPDLEWVMDLGADLVLAGHGHQYERIEKTDMPPLIIVGTGGAALRDFGTIDADSQFRYNAMHGALKITSNCDALTCEFYNVDGDLIDSKEIT